MLSLLVASVIAGAGVESDFDKYIVKKGDTLSAIAHEHNVSLWELSQSNPSIKDLDKIYINDEINIPVYEFDESKINDNEHENEKNQSDNINDYYEMMVEATAYTAYCEGCSGITKTGIDIRKNPHLKVIAVDSSVIPLGSKVWVDGYGEAIAGDIGGAIKGNRIDVFIPSYDKAIEWGRKQVKIKVYK